MKVISMVTWDKYIQVIMKLDNRYRANGKLILSIGITPSKYTLLEDMAAIKYLGLKGRFNHGTI